MTAAQLSDYVSIARKLKLAPKCMMYTPDKYHRRQFGTFQDEARDRASSSSQVMDEFDPTSRKEHVSLLHSVLAG